MKKIKNLASDKARQRIKIIEKNCRDLKIKMPMVLNYAGIDRTLYWRWKKGFFLPKEESLLKLERAFLNVKIKKLSN